ncbi:hypothetical protein [Gordonia insulae]|uniref:Uncharacterized protein n=1 Tax=Gordonia insulae TaxID=2420509 RepID=A0A3G8JMH5_9ACTN|nr:hypothetical protein [Gordonia insulae]AZG45649.1 hypothetical protein D7316_02249 [Gordonia insulae]
MNNEEYRRPHEQLDDPDLSEEARAYLARKAKQADQFIREVDQYTPDEEL